MSEPWFIAVKTFGPADGERWEKYVAWSGLRQLEELISFDAMLCPTLLPEVKDAYWDHIVNADFLLNFFTDLAFLRRQVEPIAPGTARILCVARNPPTPPVLPPELAAFKLVGYDVMDTMSGVSALTHCDGWPDVFENSELSRYGLIEDHARAVEVRDALAVKHPGEPHARCDVWAVLVLMAGNG